MINNNAFAVFCTSTNSKATATSLSLFLPSFSVRNHYCYPVFNNHLRQLKSWSDPRAVALKLWNSAQFWGTQNLVLKLSKAKKPTKFRWISWKNKSFPFLLKYFSLKNVLSVWITFICHVSNFSPILELRCAWLGRYSNRESNIQWI